MKYLLGLVGLLAFSASAADALDKRMKAEQWDSYAPFTLIPHHNNYLMPVTYVDGIAPIMMNDGAPAPSDNVEAKFQLSLKTPLWSKIYNDNGYLFFAFTQQAYWQAYNSEVSSPFRENNYEPELILMFPHYANVEDAASRIIGLSLSHQSNGRSGAQSRSWNRLKLSWVTSIGNVFINFEPYYRFKEDPKESPTDPKGDDNPDITDYMGKFEFNAAYQHDDDIYSLMLRNNLSANSRGAVELGWSFPISSNLRGQLKYFNGYGHSLIDYNVNLEVFALGIVFTDLF